MKPDKQKHIIAGASIALVASIILLALGWFGETLQLGNLPVPVAFAPLILATIAGVIREKTNKTGFSQADLYATMMGGMLGNSIPYAAWFYLG